MNRRVITVDGLSASGKSALSRALAERLGYAHLSSGQLYRAVAWLVHRANIAKKDIAPSDAQAVCHLLEGRHFELTENAAGEPLLLLDGQDITPFLHNPEVTHITPLVSPHKGVREALLPVQRQAYPGRHLVAEGRDMGTVVFPEAGIKFFVECDLQVRAGRRLKQLHSDSEQLAPDELKSALEEVKAQLADRDRRDIERSNSPVAKADGAHTIENSNRPLNAVVDEMCQYVRGGGEKKSIEFPNSDSTLMHTNDQQLPAAGGTKRIVVGFAGGSASGKETLVTGLESVLGSDTVVRLSLDSYYRAQDDTTMDQRRLVNYDEPAAFEFDLFWKHVDALKEGQTVEDAPKYSFELCTRLPEKRRLEPAPVIILDGILLYVDERASDLIDLRVFVDSSPDVRLIRRIKRDMGSERKRDLPDILRQYTQTVRPMHLHHVEATKLKAHLVVGNDLPLEEAQLGHEVVIAGLVAVIKRMLAS